MLDIYKNLSAYLPGATDIQRRDDLHYEQGSSDKVYIVVTSKMAAKNGGYVYCIDGLYGAHGNRLTATAIAQTSDLAEATRIHEKRMNEKIKKGYDHLGTGYPAKDGRHDLSHMANTLKPGNIEIMNMTQAEGKLTDEEFIVEAVGNIPLRKGVFTMFAQFRMLPHAGWYIYNIDGTIYRHEPEAPENVIEAQKHIDNVYGVYMAHGDNRLIIHDIYHLGETGKFIGTKPWKQRRTMLTHVFESIFPSRDPFDSTYYAHLSDYIYHDKKAYVDNHPDYYVMRSINSTMYANSYAFQG